MRKHAAHMAGLTVGAWTGGALAGATAALTGPVANLGGYRLPK